MYKANIRLCQRIAEEAQLLAEEKWIIEMLKKLKEQRNSLQIERLHLENLKIQNSSRFSGGDKRQGKTIGEVETVKVNPNSSRFNCDDKKSEVSPATIEVEILNVTPHSSSSFMNVQPNEPVGSQDPRIPLTSFLEFNVPIAGIDDEMCNNEELNLAVTTSVFGSQDTGAFDMEEEEEDMENCVIDMNMFMYGK